MKKTIGLLMAVLMIFALCACASPEKKIVGSWKTQTDVLGIVSETTYTFNGDGTGTMSNVLTISFTYMINDEKLSITTSTLGIKNTDEYSYVFEGDKLVLTDGDETTTFTKVK